ncbi:hypothetical protein Q9189_000103 [Teloschistes chrysophthalmus]
MASTSGETLHDCEAIELQPSKLSSSSRPKVPRPDGGKDAWLFLAGGFSVEALVWGFPFSFGVFQEYYSTHEPFKSDGGIAIIGTLSAGLMYFMTPVVIAACKRFPHLRQLCTFLGLIIMSLALVASSFAQTVWQLIITQGLLILLGALSDKYDVINVMVLASVGSVISIFLIWGFSTSIAPLYVFSIIYGVFGGGFSSCWATMVKRVQKKDSRAEMGLVFGAFAAARGIGCIASGPLTSALLKGGKDWNAGAAYGTGYGLLIVFTGVTALLGGFPGIGKGLKLY